jgi:hypothetical protein
VIWAECINNTFKNPFKEGGQVPAFFICLKTTLDVNTFDIIIEAIVIKSHSLIYAD